jgi:hypothetical protein
MTIKENVTKVIGGYIQHSRTGILTAQQEKLSCRSDQHNDGSSIFNITIKQLLTQKQAIACQYNSRDTKNIKNMQPPQNCAADKYENLHSRAEQLPDCF